MTCLGDCPSKCGDGFCLPPENAESCNQDCQTTCGDGACTGSETAASCYPDCKKVVYLPTSGDTFLVQYYPTTIYGTWSELRAGAGKSSNSASRTLIRFDLSGLGSTCTPQEGKLFLRYFDQAMPTSPTLDLHEVTVDWKTQEATWNKRTYSASWSKAGGDYEPAAAASSKVSAGAYGWISWSIDALVKQWHTTPSKNFGVIIREANDHTAAAGRKYFRSSNSGYSSYRPSLWIACTP